MNNRTPVQGIGLDFGFTLVNHRTTPAECLAHVLAKLGIVRAFGEIIAASPDEKKLFLQFRAISGSATSIAREELFLEYYIDWLKGLEYPSSLLDVSRTARLVIREYENPSNWMPYPGVRKFLEAGNKRGLHLGVLSNWGTNLSTHVSQLEWSIFFKVVLSSSELEVAKPEISAFTALANALEIPIQQVLYIGDNLTDDYLGAQRSGMQALLLIDQCNQREVPSAVNWIKFLDEALTYVDSVS